MIQTYLQSTQNVHTRENSKNFTRESRNNPTKENPQSAQDTNETFTPKKILNAHQKLTSQSE